MTTAVQSGIFHGHVRRTPPGNGSLFRPNGAVCSAACSSSSALNTDKRIQLYFLYMPQYYSKLSKACLRSPLLTPYSTTWWKTTLEKRNTTKSLRAARSAVRTKLILCVTCIGIPHSCRATVSIEINGEWYVCRENRKTRKLHEGPWRYFFPFIFHSD